ncbi:MAG: hypothetical protein BWK80_60010, partial [Desulfobacteraceae bacterium IS3]
MTATAISNAFLRAVLQTVNWRLSADQIVYTLNHTEAGTILINSDFLPILENISKELTAVKQIVVISEDGNKLNTKLKIAAEYEEMLKSAAAVYDFPDLEENTKATTFYT